VTRNILILGASYGSLLTTEFLMAGHNVTLVCREQMAALINRSGTEGHIKFRDESNRQSVFSRDLSQKLDAAAPQDADISRYDLACLAMQEPQYANHTIRVPLVKIAEIRLPCLSIMNMPPLPYLRRIPALAETYLGAVRARSASSFRSLSRKQKIQKGNSWIPRAKMPFIQSLPIE
jgi:hypothetical protein